MITIKNNFHNSEISLRANVGDELTARQIERSKRELCGMDGCTCGGPVGNRGPQDGFSIEQIDHSRVRIAEK